MPLPEGRKPLDEQWFTQHNQTYAAAYVQTYADVNRVEVIDSQGRSYAEYKASDVEISFQDDGKTLKVFLKNNKE